MEIQGEAEGQTGGKYGRRLKVCSVSPNLKLRPLGDGQVGCERALKEVDCLLIMVISDQNAAGSTTTLTPRWIK